VALQKILQRQFGADFEVRENPVTSQLTTVPAVILRNNPDRIAWLVANLGSYNGFLGFSPDVGPGKGLPLPAGGGQITCTYLEDLVLPGYEVYGAAEGATQIYVLEIIARR